MLDHQIEEGVDLGQKLRSAWDFLTLGFIIATEILHSDDYLAERMPNTAQTIAKGLEETMGTTLSSRHMPVRGKQQYFIFLLHAIRWGRGESRFAKNWHKSNFDRRKRRVSASI
jgi:hypothetical protein